jgi:ribosomal-protein-alanine N-acetyltransferase
MSRRSHRHANNRNIWLNLRDGFPHPYSPEATLRFIPAVAGRVPATSFAIVYDEQVAGSVGLRLHDDVERLSAELGYWIAEPCLCAKACEAAFTAEELGLRS